MDEEQVAEDTVEDEREGPLQPVGTEQLCAQLYDGCDCHTVNTAQGKQARGLARLPADVGVGGG
jgi:hypothetical protein